MNCKYCGKETNNPKFCSKGCICKQMAKDRVGTGKTTQEGYKRLNYNNLPNCSTCKIPKTLENTNSKDGLWEPRCRSCNAKRMRQKSKKGKNAAIEYKGGKCANCGYNKCITALDFHHLDPTQKDFNIAAKRRVIITDEIKQELDKCILLCSNCHREEHARLKDNKQSLVELIEHKKNILINEPYVEIC